MHASVEGDISFIAASMGGIATDSHYSAIKSKLLLYVGVDNLYKPKPHKLRCSHVSEKVCGDYLLSKMDVQSCISYRNFVSCMGDSRLLSKIDGYIQEHLLQISEQEEFLKLPRLKVS